MRLIDADELLKAIDTWDKFGVDEHTQMIRLNSENKDAYVPYVKYEDIITAINGMQTI